jgi:hypothetical protein
MRLVQNAPRAWRWFSVQAMALCGALQGAWVFIPDDLKAGIPVTWLNALCAALMVLGVVGRLVDQGARE